MDSEEKRQKKTGRLNLVIDPVLKEWAHKHARRNHTTVTAIIISFLLELKRLESSSDVEQI